MARTKSLLLRLTDDEYDVLVAASHLLGITPNAYAYTHLHDHLIIMRRDPHVLADQQNRSDFAASAANSETVSLSDHRKVSNRDRRLQRSKKSGDASPDRG